MSDYPQVDQLVPHRRPMQLVDRLVSEVGDVTRAEHRIGPDHVFLVPGKGVPTYVGFEMMAQSICATDGLKRWRSGRPASLGFLLGCRKFTASRDWLAVGETLVMECWQLLEGEAASYECRLLDSDGGQISTAVVNVFQPSDIQAYLSGTSQ